MADTLLFRGGSTADIALAATTVNNREIVIDTQAHEVVLGSAKKRLATQGNSVAFNSVDVSVAVSTGNLTSPSAAAVYIGNGAIQAYRDSGVNASSNAFLIGGRKNNGTEINCYLYADGSAAFSGAVSAQGSVLTSDQRFKENITDANSQLADVTALGNKLRNWDWTADAPVADKDTRFLGLVAQEAETICPGIVKTIARTKQGAELTPETTDEEGNVTPATYEELDDSYKGISNDALIMKLLGAVAELSAKVAALEAE